MVKPDAVAAQGTYPFDAKKLIEQLSLGKVNLTIAEIAQVAPELLLDPSLHHDQVINLPLGEIVKIAPKGLLQKRTDQVEEKIEGAEIPTPFSEIAKKDAQKIADQASAQNAPSAVKPAPASLTSQPVSAAPPSPAPEQKTLPKPAAPPIPRTAPISNNTPSTAPVVKTGSQPLPAMPISTVMLNKPSAGKPTIPIAPATTPISKSILTPAQRGVQAPNLLNKVSPASLGAAPTTKSLLPTATPKKLDMPTQAVSSSVELPKPVAPALSTPEQTPPPAPTLPVEPPPSSPAQQVPTPQPASSTPAVKFDFTANILNLVKKAGITETGTPAVSAYLKTISGISSCLVCSTTGNILLETDPAPENQTVSTQFAATYVAKVLRHAEPLNLSPIKQITIRTNDNKNISIYRSQNVVIIAEHQSSQPARKSSALLNDIVHELANSLS